MEPEKKRILDAEITKDFLARNQAIIQRIIQEFANQMAAKDFDAAHGYNFYLKGGNAFDLLNHRQPGGDYDFQLMPPMTAYANWGTNYQQIDLDILKALADTVTNVAQAGGGVFDETPFQVPTLQNWARTAGNPINEAHIDLTQLQRGNRRNDIMSIGTNFSKQSLEDIIQNPNYKHDRIEGEGVIKIKIRDFTIQVAQAFGPAIYVNYTVPGFILYRMVYSYQYTIGMEQFNLKSEIIDVSIPRPGSAEMYLSQEGVVTHFRQSGAFNFNIPGWGYHFFENINLIQEIELGISGSPQKKSKRIKRLKDSIDALIAANTQGVIWKIPFYSLLQMQMREPLQNNTFGPPYTNICGYFGALAYNIFDYRNVYNQIAIANILGKIQIELLGHFQVSETEWGISKYDIWEKLVYFKLSPKFDKKVKKIVPARQCLMRMIAPYNSQCGRYAPQLQMIPGVSYQFISPLLDRKEDMVLPFEYIVIEITNNVFNSFMEFCKQLGKCYVPCGPIAFLCVITDPAKEFPGVLYVIFQNCGQAVLPAQNFHLSSLLQRSILESQRYPLAHSLEQL